MKSILAMAEGPATSEIISCDQINQDLFQDMLVKSSIWDFYEITREEYMNKDDDEKKSLTIRLYNHMIRGKICICFILIVCYFWIFIFIVCYFWFTHCLLQFCVFDIKLV